MSAIWSISKALRIPLDPQIASLPDIPYTISFIIRKRQQVDTFTELPEDKRPPEIMMWDGSSEDIDEWLDRVLHRGEETDFKVALDPRLIEG